MSIGAVLTARSLDVYTCELPLCYTLPFKGHFRKGFKSFIVSNDLLHPGDLVPVLQVQRNNLDNTKLSQGCMSFILTKI